MKTIILISALAAVAALVQGQGIPIKDCPKGEHSVLYCPSMAEPSCEKPYLHKPAVVRPCDIPECFCNTGTIRDTNSGLCILPTDCQN